MAYTYSSTPVLSKIKIGNDYYYLKDADVRAIIDGFNQSIVSGQLGTVSENNKLVYSQDIKAYVDSAVSVGLVVEVVTVLPTASAENMGKIFLIAQSGGKPQDAYDEYIVVRSGSSGSYTYAWEKIGDTRIDLSGFVSDVKYTASTHTLAQQKGGSGNSYSNIHQFGSFADVNQGTATLTDYVTGGSVSVTTAGSLVEDESGLQVAGNISSITTISSVGTLPTKAADIFSANTPTAIDVSKFSGGSKAADTFNAAAITASTSTSFAKAGVTVDIGTGTDAETLIITTASTGSALTGITLSGGSFTEGSFTPASLKSGFYTAGTAATFSEGAFTQGTLPTTKSVTPTFTGKKIKFSGSTVSGSVSVTTSSKTITVNPKTN